MNVVLISIYELGRQPFSLSSPAAWLKQTDCNISCVDLAVQSFSECREVISSADVLAFSLPMHTATRLAGGVVKKVRAVNPAAHICFYGLYAPMNEAYLRSIGGETILGGEFEEGLVSLIKRLATDVSENSGTRPHQPEPLISLNRQQFLVPDRTGLPPLCKYAHLQVGPGSMKLTGYTEASRGCKHLCRHCPIVPVYKGAFRVVQRDVVLDDIRRQVAAGARHITFGDPDFFNGPTHAATLVEALHGAFPDLTYDVTIKVEHLLKHRELLPRLRDTGCLFVTSAVESIDDHVLQIYEKNHTRRDFLECVEMFHEIGLQMQPTFVVFSPWTTLKSYLELLHLLVELDLVDNVSPVQYAIRLLIPDASRLLELEEVQKLVGEFDQQSLMYPWVHADPRVDELQLNVMAAVQKGQSLHESRRQIFQRVWDLAHQAYHDSVSEHLKIAWSDHAPPRASVPFLTEPWYC
ncbi:MAG: CUAEP/CCAEP-tail radical SAM (seleno)protein [Candidatus Korobacteraceae bacterium]|jgi:tRNA A37 methylthiotransferase MiaB